MWSSTREAWHLQPGKSYLVRVFDSTLVAFRIGENPRAHLHIATAHTDFPCLRVKPSAVIASKGYGTLNVEVYGGMIRSSWLDRPLSLAGKVVLAGADPYTPEVHLVDIGRPLLTIPHLAIHMNRKVNEGETLNPQKDMLPLFTMLGMSGLDDSKSAYDAFLDFLADECHLERGRILSYELTAYPTDAPCRFGAKNEFLSASRLDNMTSVYACLEGLLQGESQNGIQCIALFDNEEVGSCTKQGADSFALPNILMRLYSSLGYGQDAYFADLARGFLLSLDVAHALHPNAPEGGPDECAAARRRRDDQGGLQPGVRGRCGGHRGDEGALRGARHPVSDVPQPLGHPRRLDTRLDAHGQHADARDGRRRGHPRDALGARDDGR